LDDGKQALNRHNIVVADAAGLDANTHFLRTRGAGMSRSSATNGPPRCRTTIARIFAIVGPLRSR
jgi:hypothetical protein